MLCVFEAEILGRTLPTMLLLLGVLLAISLRQYLRSYCNMFSYAVKYPVQRTTNISPFNH